jgi:hypothetical protein
MPIGDNLAEALNYWCCRAAFFFLRFFILHITYPPPRSPCLSDLCKLSDNVTLWMRAT